MTAAANITRAERPRDVRIIVEHCMKVGRPVMITSSPGLGKSDIIAEIGRTQARPVIDMRLLLLDPTDLKGIPYYCAETKTMRWAAPADLPSNGGPLANAILFLDEINAAPPSVQAAAYQLILNRRVGEYVLPDGVSIVCAGNKDSDKGVTYRMPSPLANRLVHVEMTHNFEDWQQWAINNNIHPEVIGFLSHHKHKLFNFDPKSPDRAFATPRSWVFVSQLLDDSLPESIITSLVAGTVGEGISIEFAAHRRTAAKLPRAEDVLNGDVTTLKVKDLSAMYSLTVSLCYTLREWADKAKTNEDGFTIDTWHTKVDNFFRFMMDNFQTELVILGAKTSLREYQLPIQHRKLKTFQEFYDQYGKLVLDV